ncbi:MAG: hypothetical protein V7641_4229 [Blastocatellia bacterium]
MKKLSNNSKPNLDLQDDKGVKQMSEGFGLELEEEIELAGGAWEENPEFESAVGRTLFDTPASKDNTVTVVVPKKKMGLIASQSLVRIGSLPPESDGDGRKYIGAVAEGPFAEPDGLRGDAPIMVVTTVRGGIFMPPYHVRVQVQVMGEEVDGSVVPPRFRPLPNSPVFVLDDEETADRLGLDGDIEIGYAVGFKDMRVRVPSNRKSVLFRHEGILGTTGGGKTTTVSGRICQYQKAGLATIVVDTEGEYTEIGEKTKDENMIKLLRRQDREPEGVKNVQVLHLVGRETTAPESATVIPFKLDFSSLSPYAAAEILGLPDAQRDRFFKVYNVVKLVLRDLNIFPRKGDKKEEQQVLEIDEFESGYPGVTLSRLIDITDFFIESMISKKQDKNSKKEEEKESEASMKGNATGFEPFNSEFKTQQARQIINRRISAVNTSSEISWHSLKSKLWGLHSTKVFDQPNAHSIPFKRVLKPGQVTIVDLSDTDSHIINNLVIANLLRGLQLQQEEAYKEAQRKGQKPTPAMIIIEEAHEFLSKDKIEKMENLFQQVARIARRGRKRWLGLTFVTQLPQHLPDEVLGLINNFVLHKISDTNVISRLKRSIGGIDEALWNRLPNLTPGQAIVFATSMTRPLLVSIDPTPCRLRMID